MGREQAGFLYIHDLGCLLFLWKAYEQWRRRPVRSCMHASLPPVNPKATVVTHCSLTKGMLSLLSLRLALGWYMW